MDAHYVDTFGARPTDDLSDTSIISRSEVDSYYTYPDGFIPCKKCKNRERGSPLCWKCWLASLHLQRKIDNERPRGKRSVLELVTHKMRSAPSSSLSEWEQDEDYDLASTELEDSAVGIQPWLARLDEAEPYVDVQESDDRALASTRIRTRRDSSRPYPASSSSNFWNDGGSDWTRRICCDWCSENSYQSPTSADQLSTDSDMTDYVMIPRAEFIMLQASQKKSDGDKDTMTTEPSIGDVLYLTRRWLVTTTGCVTDPLERWLALIVNWIRQACSRIQNRLGMTTRSDQQQEDEDVD
ncbi:hypothetical protein F4782DRAFT_532919 [Xylaria castorea]|nr:hypothetical protein F4782DRAFT_532919 [Xylaria castorea]